MTTLVTGAGLIGCLTAEMLLSAGETVVLIDVRNKLIEEPKGNGRLIYQRCDVTDQERLTELVVKYEVKRIVHTAAMLSTSARAQPFEAYRVNAVGAACIVETARLHGIGRVILASSTTVGYSTFGSRGPTPIEEDFPARVVSNRPGSIYAASKLAGENIGLLYSDLYGVDVVILRYGAVLGKEPGPPSSVPGRLLATLSEAGRAKRIAVLNDPILLWHGREEFVDARDCARANVHALVASQPKQRVYNIATGAWHTLDEFITAVQNIYPGLRVEIPHQITTGFAGFPFTRPAPSDVTAAERELAFRAAYSLEETVSFCAA
jgi:UDP-glucose 4-epimerase